MIKKTITYTDFNDKEQTVDAYFHISIPELIQLETEYDGGLKETLERMMSSTSQHDLVRFFSRLIDISYGVRSEDGSAFVKDDERGKAFRHTAAYAQLFEDISGDADLAIEFIMGILPTKLQAEIKSAEARGELSTKTTTTVSNG